MYDSGRSKKIGKLAIYLSQFIKDDVDLTEKDIKIELEKAILILVRVAKTLKNYDGQYMEF